MRALRRCWLSGLFLAFGMVFWWATTKLGPTARLVPENVVEIVLMMLSIQFMLDIFPGLAQRLVYFDRLRLANLERYGPGRQTPAGESAPGRSDRAFWNDLLWFGLVPVLIIAVGFAVTAPIYTFLFLVLRGGYTRWKCALVAGAVALAVLGFFELMPGAPTDRGILITLLKTHVA